jgi:hypothetical protein
LQTEELSEFNPDDFTLAIAGGSWEWRRNTTDWEQFFKGLSKVNKPQPWQ